MITQPVFDRKSQLHKPIWRLAVMMLVCYIVYYIPVFLSLFGTSIDKTTLNQLHNFFGIDFFALIFFVPVVYAAYKYGIFWSLCTALTTMIALLPYNFIFGNGIATVFQPTAFAIILSAVGAVVAMLQKSDLQKRSSSSELQCLYEIGQTVENSPSQEDFCIFMVDKLTILLKHHNVTGICLKIQSQNYHSLLFKPDNQNICRDLVAGNESIGQQA